MFSDKIKKLITDLYYPGSPEAYDVKMPLFQIKAQLNTVIPPNGFDEYELTEILEELGFEPKYEKKVETVIRDIPGETDLEGNPIQERDEIWFDDFVYYYYFQKIE